MGCLQTHQPDDVAAIGVETLIDVGTIAALARVLVVIDIGQFLDMAQHMPLGVLRHRAPQILADAIERGGSLQPVVIGDWKAPQQQDAAPMDKVLADPGEGRAEHRQWKGFARDVHDVETRRLDAADSLIDIGDLVRREAMDIVAGFQHIGAGPVSRMNDLLQRNGGLFGK